MAEHLVSVTATGGAGTSTGTAYTEVPVRGFIEAVVYTYTSAPGTTTITISERDGAQRTLLSIPAGNTNGVAYPQAVPVNQSGASIAGGWVPIYVANHALKVAVAAANNNSIITVRFIVSGDYLGQ